MWNSFLALILNIVFNLILVKSMGHNGLAPASSISNILPAIFLLYQLRKKIGSLGLTAMIQSSIKIVGSSTIMGVVVYLVYNYSMIAFTPSRLGELILVVSTVFIGGIIYLAFLYFLKVKELHFLINTIKDRVKIKK